MRARVVVVCDLEGRPLRNGDVLEVHQGAGVLHKAFSVFVFRTGGAEILLQQRSPLKRVFPLRWANTCCSHTSPAEASLAGAAERRLREECGFSVALREAGAFVYRAEDPDTHLTEYEHDTVLIGDAPEEITVRPDPDEIAAWRWIAISDLQRELRVAAAAYAPWLPQALQIAVTERRRRTR